MSALIVADWPVRIRVAQHRVAKQGDFRKDVAWYLVEVEWSSGHQNSHWQRFSIVYEALVELQHELPHADALRRLPGKRAFPSTSELARSKRASELEDTLTACVSDPQIQKHPTFVALCAPPNAGRSAVMGSGAASDLSALGERSSTGEDLGAPSPSGDGAEGAPRGTAGPGRGPTVMSLNSVVLSHHNSRVGRADEVGPPSGPSSNRSESERGGLNARGPPGGGSSQLTGAAASGIRDTDAYPRSLVAESYGFAGPAVPTAWPHRTEAQVSVVQGESAATLCMHVEVMAQLLGQLREQLAARSAKLAALEAENSALRDENETMRQQLRR